MSNSTSKKLIYQVSISPEGLLFQNEGDGWEVIVDCPSENNISRLITLFTYINTEDRLIELILELYKLIQLNYKPSQKEIEDESAPVTVLYDGNKISNFLSIKELVIIYIKNMIDCGRELEVLNLINECKE